MPPPMADPSLTWRTMRPLSESTRQTNEELAKRILAIAGGLSPDTSPHECPTVVLKDADAIVSHIEVNENHGVGVLLARLFSQYDNIVSIRSKDFYEGRQTFGAVHICISHGNAPRDEVFWKVVEGLRGSTVKRVLCVPYFPDDALNAIALKELFGVPLCTFLMDDQNLAADGIPDSLMRELLAKSALRMAISPELYEGYGLKYGYKMSFMPPLVSTRFILTRVNQLPDAALSPNPQSSSGIFGASGGSNCFGEPCAIQELPCNGTTTVNSGGFPAPRRLLPTTASFYMMDRATRTREWLTFSARLLSW